MTSLRIPFIVDKVVDKKNAEVLKKGDRLVAINGTPVKYLDEMKPVLQENKGKEVTATIVREGKPETLKLHIDEQGLVGVSLSNNYKEWVKQGIMEVETKKYSFFEACFLPV